MNIVAANRIGRNKAVNHGTRLAMKARAAMKRMSVRDARAEEHHHVIAGAPYYRGLRWSL